MYYGSGSGRVSKKPFFIDGEYGKLQWGVTCEDGYTLYISKDRAFDELIFAFDTMSNEVSVSSLAAGIYYARLKNKNENNISPTYTFEI